MHCKLGALSRTLLDPIIPCRFSPLFHRTQWAMAAGAQTNGAVVAEAFQKVEAFLPSAEWV